MKRKLVLGAWLSLCLAASWANPLWNPYGWKPIYQPPRVELPAQEGQPPGVDRVRRAIIGASRQYVWEVAEEHPGALTLKHVKNGKHEAVVRVDYDAAGYQVHYVSSVNLDYGPCQPHSNRPDAAGIPGARSLCSEDQMMIHAIYNTWVRNLAKAIEGYFRP